MAPVYTEGPLIHNPQVLEKLEKKGIIALDEDTGFIKEYGSYQGRMVLHPREGRA